ncbi:MAG: hypothetical protein ACW97A_00505 [Candidatus Thorarchaeota archaeon]|jgi:hypothetical protein
MKERLRISILLMLILLLVSPLVATTGIYNEVISTPEEETPTENILSETDLNRVDWTMNHIPNPGFEDWQSDHVPEDLYTSRSTEHYVWSASPPWPVNQGSNSVGLQVRALDSTHPAEAILSRSSWLFWDNPSNLTLSFDWFVEEIPDTVNFEYFRIKVELGVSGTRNLLYYLGGNSTIPDTYSSASFNITGLADLWNGFDRNITQDCYDAFAEYPTQFRLFKFEMSTTRDNYLRGFIDDLWLVNQTIKIGGSTGNGDFDNFGGWYFYSNKDPADVSRSAVRQEGDWSLNATVISYGNESQAFVRYTPYKRVSALNPGNVIFQWRINELEHLSEDTYAYVLVHTANETESFYTYYILTKGGTTTEFGFQGVQYINATGYNTTSQWNSFNRDIWADVTSFNQTSSLYVEEILLYLYARNTGARISILFDDLSFVNAAMGDMSYEDQLDAGETVMAWDIGSEPSSLLTVTDQAHTGSKAANLTVINEDEYSGYQDFEDRTLNRSTDTYLDLFWRLEEFTGFDSDWLYIEVYFSSYALAYILANGSDVQTENGFDEFIMLPEANSIGTWNNLQRNLFDDYELAFGDEPDTEIYEVSLHCISNESGRIEVLFDDVYLYDDPEPEIVSVDRNPLAPVEGESVNITAEIIEPSLESVVLMYRVDEGTWQSLSMMSTLDQIQAAIPGQSADSVVEYFVNATDSVGMSTSSDHYEYIVAALPPTTPTPTVPPPDLLPLIAVAIIGAIFAVLIIAYFLVLKPRQSSE